MTKNEFLDTLRGSLNDEIPKDKVNENIMYYDEYISQNIAKGKTEDEMFIELGEPRLIAKTIIETYKMSKSYQYSKESHSRPYDNINYDNQQDNYQGNSEDNGSNKGGWNSKFNRSLWFQKLFGILILILIIFVVIVLGSVAIKIFFTFGFPIIVMYLLYKVIFNQFKRR